MTLIPGLIWSSGPFPKVNAGSLQRKGAVLHSSEGSLNGAMGRLAGPAQVSWHVTIDVDGTGYQHYEIDKQCWHAKAEGNVNYLGIEFPNQYTNGSPDHRPLTQAQVNKAIEVLKFVFDLWGLRARRITSDFLKTLWEHNEVPGNATACPSGRIPWDAIVAGLNLPIPLPVAFICGDKNGGIEKRGHQLVIWNEGVPIFVFGNEEGSLAGQIAKNFGGRFHWLVKGIEIDKVSEAAWQSEPGD